MTQKLKQTPSQTAGPYVHIGCMPARAGVQGMFGGQQDLGAQMIGGDVPGQRIVLTGGVYDGTGAPVTDAMIEMWQADASGQFRGQPGFSGWGRVAVDATTGRFRIDTILPGSVQGQAPHLMLWITARGINAGLHTRVYFDGQDNARDPVLRAAGDRAPTLIARQTGEGYEFNIHLQDPDKAVFLDV